MGQTVVAPPPTNNVLYGVSNSQAETCLSGTFRRATSIDSDYLAVCGSGRNCVATAETHEPLVEWDAEVPFARWSFDDKQKHDPFPLGFRRNVIQVNKGGVMCLRIPEQYANHKVEVAVETAVKGTICIADTRQAALNQNANELASACDLNGQLISCFSTMQNGAIDRAAADAGAIPPQTSGPSTTEGGVTVSGDPIPETATDYSKGFAVVIGCPGNGCWETDGEIFYRVRVSKVTWDDSVSENSAEKQLDMWCMMLGSRDPVNWQPGMIESDASGISQLPPVNIEGTTVPVAGGATVDDALGDSKANLFPQLFPSDLWGDKNAPSGETQEDCAAGRCPDPASAPGPGEQGYIGNAANAVQASYIALVLPLLALLF